MKRAFVLLSGGMDSTTCLHKAILDFCPPDRQRNFYYILGNGPVDWVEAISIDYGQRHKREMEYAARTCKNLGIAHTILKTSALMGDAMLTNPDMHIPSIDYADIKGVSPTYVPFRNGTFLAMIAAHAQKWVTQQKQNNPNPDGRPFDAAIYFGAHAEDAQNWAYPDCTPEFIGAMANAIYIGTYHAVRLHAPLQWLNKAEIIMLGERLHVDWANTFSCYAGGEVHCGVCPTCRARRTAFKMARVIDPTVYA